MEMKLSLPELQFYWRQTDKPNNPSNPVENFLPFEFEFIEDLQLVKQKVNPLVVSSLERVYQEDFCVGYLDDNNSLAKLYGNDFLDFLSLHIPSDSPQKILEIGCGRGFLLQHLHKLGHHVKGLDPSPSAQQGNPEIEVIADFFPSIKVTKGWDFLLHYDVLEHAENVVDFLKAQRELLSEKGKVIFAVPDCTDGLEKGDLSVILHEHINYFDLESLGLLLKVAGFRPISIKRSMNVGTIYCVAEICEPETLPKGSSEKFLQFRMKAQKNISTFQKTIVEARDSGKKLGFYVPLRFLPYLSIAGLQEKSDYRFFDDSTAFKGKYFDGFRVQIEGGESLLTNPVDLLFIGSYIFGDKIRSKFTASKMKMITVSELFGDLHGV